MYNSSPARLLQILVLMPRLFIRSKYRSSLEIHELFNSISFPFFHRKKKFRAGKVAIIMILVTLKVNRTRFIM